MKRLVASLALVLASAGVLSAGCPRIRASSHAKFVQAVPIVYAQQYVQAYGGSYGQPQQQQNDDLLRRLVEFLERQEALGAFNNAGGGHTGLSIMRQACASCHTDGKNPKKGFIMVNADGSPAELSVRDQDLVQLRVQTTDPKIRMPPERNLPEQLQNVLIQQVKGGK